MDPPGGHQGVLGGSYSAKYPKIGQITQIGDRKSGCINKFHLQKLHNMTKCIPRVYLGPSWGFSEGLRGYLGENTPYLGKYHKWEKERVV